MEMKRETMSLCAALVRVAVTGGYSLGHALRAVQDEFDSSFYLEEDEDWGDILELIDTMWYNQEHSKVPDFFDKSEPPFV